MKIKLTRDQWLKLIPLVKQGRRSELALGLPVSLDNGDQHIDIEADEVKIILED